MTLDQAQDAFRANPSPETAKTYTAAIKQAIIEETADEHTLYAAMQELMMFLVEDGDRLVAKIRAITNRRLH